MLERDHHPTYVVMLTDISTDPDRALRGTEPSLYVLRGTPLGAESYLNRRLEEAADAYLYLGHKLDYSYPDWNALEADKAYFSEIQRRYPLQFGCSLNLETWKGSHPRPCP